MALQKVEKPLEFALPIAGYAGSAGGKPHWVVVLHVKLTGWMENKDSQRRGTGGNMTWLHCLLSTIHRLFFLLSQWTAADSEKACGLRVLQLCSHTGGV